ncbi:MAG: YqgE/AlgH family protein [Salibacteraceae bacterium]
MINPESIEHNFFHNLNYSFDVSKLKRGDVLISDPFLSDPNFARTVVLLSEYSKEDGAVGFILNRPSEMELCDVVLSFNGQGYPFYFGGPVKTDGLFFVHQRDLGIDDCHPINDELSWSSNFEEAQELHSNGKLPTSDIRFFGGYSGWSPNQLEQEIKEKSWIITSLNAEQVLNGNENSLWKRSLKQLGAKFSIMSEFPENPNMN